jgi:predicted TIM-barrel fold metal-dependent hydrolase
MYQGPIIDTHHHLWEVRNYPWLVAPPSPKIFGESYEPLRQDYLIDDLRADFGKNNVVKSVHMQAHYLPHDPVGETTWLQSVADRHGFPHGIAGHVHLAADNAEELIDGHCRYANFRSIRDVVYWSPLKPSWQAVDRPDFCLTPAFRRGIDLLGKRGINFELQGFPNQFDYFAELVGETPQVRFCLVHCGLLIDDEEATVTAWENGLRKLVDLPNLLVKCSGVNLLNWGPPRDDAPVSRQYNALLDMFGAERCFFGSNFPVEKLKTGYDGLIAMLKAALAHRPASEQRQFFHDTAMRFYRI